MNTLPTLPLIDGCLFVDNSFLETLTTCPRAAQYSKLNSRVSSADKPALNFGSAIHLALEHRYKTYKNQSPDTYFDDEIATLLSKYFEDNPQPMDDFRNLNWALEVVRKYNEKYPIEPFSLLESIDGPMVEMSFALPLFTYRGFPNGGTLGMAIPIVYSGRIDLPVMRDGQLFILDHKTTSMLGSSFWEKAKMSTQGRGYCWAFEQLTGQVVTGFGINAIRSKEPPQYVLNGKSGKSGEKMSPAKWWDESLQREWFYLKESDLAEWKTNTIAKIEWFFQMYQNQFFPMFNPNPCTMYGKCAYFDVCTCAENERGVMLSSGLFTDNVWSPLKEVAKVS